jgi:hypothetical protein
MAKKSAKRGKLHPVSFQQFVKEIYKDPKLKANTIAELQSLGFRAFATKHFDLITRQKKELDTIKDADVEAVFTNGVVAALNRNGPIELIHEGHNPPNMRIEFYARGGGGGLEVGVRITC